jgi:cytochrome oxidase Cu insertion factor (SCO1/SenC/PrrC family)
MARMIDLVQQQARGRVLRPVFVSCDPARDTPAVVKAYLREFHPALLGLTGSYEQIKATCKAYRVYFSTPPDVKPGQDYLVDHSIYFYLMGACLFLLLFARFLLPPHPFPPSPLFSPQIFPSPLLRRVG